MVIELKKTKVWFFFVCTAVVAVALSMLGLSDYALPVSGNVSDWGLSFKSPGEPPRGNRGAEELLPFDAYYLGDTGKKTIYLTFDAGFENGHTPGILDVLKKHKVPAAFFLVGNVLKSEKELVRRMATEGHTVGNHTATHPDMAKISAQEDFARELQSVETIYRKITGKEMEKIYRPPQGKFSESNLRMAKELGYKTVFWSLAYVDWNTDNQPDRQQAFDKLIPRVHNGAVILLHSTSATNADILDELITRYKALGFSFAPVSSLWDKEPVA